MLFLVLRQSKERKGKGEEEEEGKREGCPAVVWACFS